jgi:outer membrane protein assembly factor BamB
MHLLLLTALLANDNWAEFRGPSGSGHSDAKGLPREWSESKNVVWKTAIRGKGWSSPVVWGKQVWLTSAHPDGKELYAICLDRETGKVLLDEKLFEVENPEQLWKKYNSYASPSPYIEDGRVYLHWGTYGTACLDTATFKPVWTRRDLPCNHWRGAGSSPVVWKNLLILTFDGYDQQYVAALDKETGKDVWRADRKHDFGTTDGDMKKGFGTPVVVELGGKPVLLSPAAKALVALDPATGKQLWQFRHPEHSAASRPLFGHGLIFLSTGFGKSQLLGIKPGGEGDLPQSHVAWKVSKGIGSKPSPLLVDDLVYSAGDGGLVTCVDAKSGEQVWQQRVGNATYTASPLYADGALWFFAENGSATVVATGREFKELGKGKLDQGGVMGTPAVAGKSLFIRTESTLYRVEAK